MLANITNWAVGIWFVVLDGDLDLYFVPDQEQNALVEPTDELL